jgi:hypothetical protein
LKLNLGGIGQFLIGESFHLEYLVKLQAQTYGSYYFSLNPGPSFKICRIALTHVGRNFPCTKMPGPIPLLADNVALTWSDPANPNACGTGVTMSFLVKEKKKIFNLI